MIELVSTVALALFVLYFIYFIYFVTYKLPGPFTFPFVYNLPQVMYHRWNDEGNHWYDFWVNITIENGKTWGMAIPLESSMILICEPECVKHIFE